LNERPKAEIVSRVALQLSPRILDAPAGNQPVAFQHGRRNFLECALLLE